MIPDKVGIRDERFEPFCRRSDLERSSAIAAAAQLARMASDADLAAARLDCRDTFEKPLRYPGHDRWLGWDAESLQQRLIP
jgi:hypothetical protein